MAVTIKDLSKKTGLGYATISAFLNGTRVRPENKEKIENAIKELGYIRNEYARGLKMHASLTIGVLIPELSNLFSTTIITAMEDELRRNGYGIIVCDCRTDAQIEQQSLKFLQSKMVDGLIIMPVSEDVHALDVIKNSGIPIVVIDRMTDDKDVSHVVINNRDIAKSAVERLINSGCRHIALIGGGEDVYTARERHKGYKDALDNIGCYSEEYIYNGRLSIEGGYLAMKEAISKHPELDGIFVINYEMTIGAYMAVKEAGKDLAEDYSFVGFDGGDIAKVVSPSLVVVEQPLEEIGKTSADLIVEMISSKNDSSNIRDIVLPATISEGESVR